MIAMMPSSVPLQADPHAADMLSADAGLGGAPLAASSMLAHLAEDGMGVNAVVAEARERMRWLSSVSRRRAAIAALCDEQRQAYVAMWQRRVETAERARNAREQRQLLESRLA